MINYVLITYPDDEILRRYKDYLKKDRTSYNDTEINVNGTSTWDEFSIYSYHFPEDDGLVTYSEED